MAEDDRPYHALDPEESVSRLHSDRELGLVDPPRDDIADSIQECQRAGMRVIMVTGDRPDTGQAIGEQVGIAHDGSVAHGSELADWEQLSDDDRRHLLETSVFARVTPEQKLNLVKLYQQHGEVVAMAGDGVNDAPALKQADIRKSVMFMLCTNLAEILVVTLASLAQAPIPLRPPLSGVLQTERPGLLHWKEPLHAVVQRIGEADIRAIIQFLLIALVILPIVPNESYGPYGVINPFERGLISSTATTVSYAHRARRNPEIARLATLVIVIASTIVFGIALAGGILLLIFWP